MVTDNHYRWDFIQLSTDTKPTPATSKKVTDGSTLYTSDDSKLYVWYKDQWYEKEATGGGGGSSYTAGDGIDIANNVISVDTDVIPSFSDLPCRDLTVDDYNFTIDGDDSIAMWLLPAGIYLNPSGLRVSLDKSSSPKRTYLYISFVMGTSRLTYWVEDGEYARRGFQYWECDKTDGTTIDYGYAAPLPINNLNSTTTNRSLSANQGRVLNERIGDLSTLTTTAKTNVVSAINELAQGGGGGSSAIELTENSFNANSNNWNDTDPANFNCVAMWLLPFGNYYVNNASRSDDNKIPVYISKSTSSFDASYTFSYYILVPHPQQSNEWYVYCYGSSGSSDSYGQQFIRCYDVYSNGTLSGSPDSVVTKSYISDFVTTGDLYATPTPSDGGTVGRFYRFNNNGTWELWVCLDDDGGTGNSYTWKQVNLT